MPVSPLKTLALLLSGCTLLHAFAQTPAPTPTAASAFEASSLRQRLPFIPPPNPSEYDTDPPRPAPTPAQLAKGQAILEKIVYLIQQVDLADGAAAILGLGFENYKKSHGEKPSFYPADKNGERLNSTELSRFGFVSVASYVHAQKTSLRMDFDFDFDLTQTCITPEMLHKAVGAWTVQPPLITTYIMDIHPVIRPPKLHGMHFVEYTPHKHNKKFVFVFEFQACAKKAYLYQFKSSEE